MVAKINGGRHGPDFYPFSLLQRDRFRIDVFSRHDGPYAARCYLYGIPLFECGLRESYEWLRGYVRRLGCEWTGGQVSRIDLCADVRIPFTEFQKRIDDQCFVTRMRDRLPNGKAYDTTRYFGRKDYLQLCIYDKALELGIEGPLTRVEFRAGRKFLRRQDFSAIDSLKLPKLWKKASSSIRLTDKRPDKTHQSRYPTWDVWNAIQRGRWKKRDTFPRGKPKSHSEAKWRPPRPKRRQSKAG